jgi:hypothetical protein
LTACLQQRADGLNEKAKQLWAEDAALLCATCGGEGWTSFPIDLHLHVNVLVQPRESVEKHPRNAHATPLLKQKSPVHDVKGHAEVNEHYVEGATLRRRPLNKVQKDKQTVQSASTFPEAAL